MDIIDKLREQYGGLICVPEDVELEQLKKYQEAMSRKSPEPEYTKNGYPETTSDTCPVPPITCKMGRYWEQPDPHNFVWDKDCVAMTEQDYYKLHTYDCTNPTGIYEGKMWKCHSKNKAYLKYVTECPGEPDYCTIHCIEIIVI